MARIEVRNRRRSGRIATLVRALAAAGVMAVLGGAVGGLGVYTHFARGLPSLERFDDLVTAGVTRFRAADGQIVGEWSREKRVLLRWNQLPRRLVLSFLAAEDARFFFHDGIDLKGVARAVVVNLRAGEIREGASTITQQLAKTLVGRQKTFTRKIREAILARRLEAAYTKQELLTWYLNAIYLGEGSYGVQTAAQNYFRKPVWDLELVQLATLAGLPQAPSALNPRDHPKKARTRLRHVLDQMKRRGWIGGEEHADALERVQGDAEAIREGLGVHPPRDPLGDHVPYYTSTVRERIAKRYAPEPPAQDGDAPERSDEEDAPERRSWLDRGLRISMHVEPAHHRVAQQELRRALEDLQRRQGWPGALGQLDRETFLRRSARFWPEGGPAEGDRVLGRVRGVSRGSATVELHEGWIGALRLEDMRWAGRYSEYDTDERGRPIKEGRVSFRTRLSDMREALSEGDVVRVEVTGGEPSELELELVPVPQMEGAFISYPTRAGGVQALVGGWDWDRSEVNRVFSVRQNGSTMKPIVYSKAYELGLPPSERFSGAPFRKEDVGQDEDYTPTGDEVEEDQMLWDALAASVNSVSLRVLQYVLREAGREGFREWGRKLGLTQELDGHTSEILGDDQTLWGMAHAFGVFDLRGLEPRMPLVRKVVDRDGRVLERNISPLDPHASFEDAMIALWDSVESPRPRRISEETAYLTAANMREVVQRGTGRRARRLTHDVAGKTGTLAYDVWFVGYHRERVAGAWIGADRRERPLGISEEVNKVYGSDTALPAWLGFMERVDVDRPVNPLTDDPPDGIVWKRIDPGTGLLAREDGREVPHVEGTAPTRYGSSAGSSDSVHEFETEF